MNISEAARAADLTVKAVRYYEQVGLLCPTRSASGYRDYSAADLETLRFIQRARATGFSLDEAGDLLALYRSPLRKSREAKDLVEAKLQYIDRQLWDLQAVRETLMSLSDACAGNEHPECAILDGLAKGAAQ
ncbi:MerR family transcriptional regulator [Biformimicrobium ophioploci]|uniref:Cu(I)-responsive transcriptional regulator n=1 Tax=Biformimicrobium ophioploci TaxID=3036711 RepID=A0ABQ6LZU5_9GAMM|nr:MerR family transcriptional regulator [Microbulbifer sp. NKW57]GMG87567.1 Cu(I)-responsive transcriptional regulator [Microbulbifer sp. NKW57]